MYNDFIQIYNNEIEVYKNIINYAVDSINMDPKYLIKKEVITDNIVLQKKIKKLPA